MAGATAALTLLATTSVAAAEGFGGAYSLGFSATAGNAYLPPTSSSGISTGIAYHEYGGVISKVLLLLLTVPPKPRETSTTSTECYGDTCYITTTTYYPSQAEMDNWNRDVDTWSKTTAPAILSGAIKAEVNFDVASRSLGGDTSGASFSMLGRIPIRSLGGVGGNLAMGMGFGSYTFHDRTRKVVVANGSTLDSVEQKGDLDYDYIGFPVRLQAMVKRNVAIYLQLDLNLLALELTDDSQASPARLGLHWLGPRIYLRAEAVTDNFGGSRISGMAEVGFAF